MAAFTFPMALNQMGVFATNTNTNEAPAWSAVLDSFDNTASPSPADDTTPPAISAVKVDASSGSATITWHTDEPSDSQVAYGPTSTYGNQTVNAALSPDHAVALANLPCG